MLSSPVREKLPGVFPDFPSVGRLRAEHLLSRGLHRFAALTSEQFAQVLELKAFTKTIEEAGYSCATGTVPKDPSSSASRWRATERVIASAMMEWTPPIGVYAGTEQWGRMVAQMCANRGWRVPEDVAIIAGHNEESFCRHLRPTLTSVEVGYEQIGYEAARLLDRLMDGNAPPTEPIWLPPQGLVVRESTDFAAVDDELIAAALKFIAEKSHLDIAPEDVSRAVNTQTRTLQRHFRRYLNRPIATEIRRVRIQRAKRELAQSKRSLAQIAHDAGFGVAMRMYEVFRRELGITPSQYRRERKTARNVEPQ